jgi:hypothetical protein
MFLGSDISSTVDVMVIPLWIVHAFCKTRMLQAYRWGSHYGRRWAIYFMLHCSQSCQSINVSCNSYLEHRASTTHCHRTLFFAATFTPFQFRPRALTFIWTDLLHVLFGRPLHLEPCGFHSRVVRFTSAWGFHNVCPNHPHFLHFISSFTGTWAILLHRSWLLIVSGHLTWRILHRYRFIKVCSIFSTSYR